MRARETLINSSRLKRVLANVLVSALRLFTVFTIRFQSRALIPNRWQGLRRDEWVSVSLASASAFYVIKWLGD